MGGMVYLVGAGPGDPGCLTLRGRECLRRAQVVLYDYLANPALLRHAPEAAERIFAGKHGSERKVLEQAEINQLLATKAREGRVVVRLKGGDPFVFGRGGEEAEFLSRERIPFEVVPGVTAALAAPAFAGIPATHRDWVSGVSIVTGHEASEGSRVPWQGIAAGGSTIVLLMAVKQIRATVQRLLESGLARDTPSAAIHWGSTPRQRVLVAPVEHLAERMADANLKPPVTVVIGRTVALRDHLSWFERRPLFGRRILVTRARVQASGFAAILEEAGAEVLECPTIEIAPPPSPEDLDRALDGIDRFDWIIFTSANGVERFFARLAERGMDVRAMHRARVAVIGPETERALARRHVRAAAVPATYRAEGILDALADVPLTGARILLPRALGAREILPRVLTERGAIVEEVVTYRSLTPPSSRTLLIDALGAGRLDAVTFTSSSTVRGFLELMRGVPEDSRRRALEETTVACIGPITAETAREAGLSVSIVPEAHTVRELARALIAQLGQSPAERPPLANSTGGL